MPRSIFVALVLLASTGWTSPAQRSLAGTYDLLLCRESCTVHSAVYQRGVLVLSDTLWPKTRPLDWDHRAANGCFALLTGPGRSDSYAGIIQRAAIHWEPVGETDSIAFLLYMSPDASYRVAVVPTAEGLRGSGNSSGAGVAEIHAPADSIVAIRTGAPDPARCRRT